jgi:Zn finger protein HypA/HybF involved in hydrogenase expression
VKTGTLLSLISSKSLYIECRDCGHSSVKPVGDFIVHLGASAAVKDVIARITCSKCHKSKPAEVRIVPLDYKPEDDQK